MLVVALTGLVVIPQNTNSIYDESEPVFVGVGAAAEWLGTRHRTNSVKTPSANATRRPMSFSAFMM